MTNRDYFNTSARMYTQKRDRSRPVSKKSRCTADKGIQCSDYLPWKKSDAFKHHSPGYAACRPRVPLPFGWYFPDRRL